MVQRSQISHERALQGRRYASGGVPARANVHQTGIHHVRERHLYCRHRVLLLLLLLLWGHRWLLLNHRVSVIRPRSSRIESDRRGLLRTHTVRGERRRERMGDSPAARWTCDWGRQFVLLEPEQLGCGTAARDDGAFERVHEGSNDGAVDDDLLCYSVLGCWFRSTRDAWR